MEQQNMKSIMECIRKMRIGDSDSGMKLFLDNLPMIQQFLLEQIDVNQDKEIYILSQLQNLLDGMEKKDIVLLADIMEYEIMPMMDKK